MKLGILGTGMIVREFLPWLAGPDCPFTVQALCSTQRSAPAAARLAPSGPSAAVIAAANASASPVVANHPLRPSSINSSTPGAR